MEAIVLSSHENKLEFWENIRTEVERFGKEDPIEMDEGIKDTLVGLIAAGFTTSGSCFGHLDKGTPYPWVWVTHPGIDQLYGESSNNNALFEKYELDETSLSQEENQRMDEIQEQVRALKAEVIEKLNRILEEFYLGRTPVPGIKLVVSKFGWLQSEDTLDDVAQAPDMLKSRIVMYREEMNAFAEFLKGKYFNS